MRKGVATLSRPFLRLTTILLFVGLGTAQTETAENQSPRLRIEVKAADSGKGLENARVLVSSSDGSFTDESRTDGDGTATFSEVPSGKVTIIVTLNGWETSRGQYPWQGHDTQTILIKLNRENPPNNGDTEKKKPSPTPSPDH